MTVLNQNDITAAVKNLPGWEHADGALRRSVTFGSFLDGIEAVRLVAEHAERHDHHPDIDIRWRTVIFTLVTHSAGGITDKDVQMAAELNELLGDH
ncbi:4a-hydroxytetrahydrobiopterin dehydratase [Mycolicibacterium sp. CBM1]